MEDNGDGYLKFFKDGQNFVKSPNAVDDQWLPYGMCQFDLTDEYDTLKSYRCWATCIQSTFPDGQDFRRLCGIDQAGRKGRLFCLQIPGMQPHGVPAPDGQIVEIGEDIPDGHRAPFGGGLVRMDIDECHRMQFRLKGLKILRSSGSVYPAMKIFFCIDVQRAFLKGQDRDSWAQILYQLAGAAVAGQFHEV